MRARCSIAGALAFQRDEAFILGQEDVERLGDDVPVLEGGGVGIEPAERAAQQPHGPIGALDIAAQPEQIIGDAAAQAGAAARDFGRVEAEREAG